MKTQKHIEDEIEKTLHAFDRTQQLPDNPGLYEQIFQRQQQRSKAWIQGKTLRPVLNSCIIALILLLNAVAVIRFVQANTAVSQREHLVQVLQNELGVTQTSVIR